MPRYKTYHGRKKSRRLRNAVIFLLAGGFLSLCVFVLPNYITYSDDGLSINLPFLSWMTRKPPSPPPPQNTVVIEIPSPSPSPETSPSPAPRRNTGQVRAFFLPLTSLGDLGGLEDIRARAVAEGINMLALEIKDVQGTAVNRSILADAIEVLAHPGLTLTAVISACADNTVPFGPNADWAVKHISGVNFKDNLDRRWLNLYLPEVRAFIIEQVTDAYGAGFDRVLLTNVGFPHSGGTVQADYGGEDLTIGPVGAVNRLLGELREAAGDRFLDVWLFENTYNEGLFETAGQDLAVFTETFDLMFVTLPDDVTSMEKPFIPVIPPGGAEAEQGYMVQMTDNR